MSHIIKGRVTTIIEDDFVILIIGMSINKLWKIHHWIPIVFSMFKMISEQKKQKDIGLLATEHKLIGNPTVFVQYWKSYEALEAYASDSTKVHLPAWVNYNKKVRDSEDIGIYHEIYKIKATDYECVYVNMPRFGLGKFGELIPATGRLNRSKDRMDATNGEQQ